MDKKQEILMAAFDIFCEKGYHLSVAELAGAVKIKTPSLYSHFASKDEIIELVVRDEIERYYAYLHEWMLKIEGLYCKEAMKNLYNLVFGFHIETIFDFRERKMGSVWIDDFYRVQQTAMGRF